MKIELSQVYNLGGKEFKEFEVNIEEMTGKDFLQCEKEFKARNKETGAVKELEDSWALTVAAKAIDVKFGDLLSLKSIDYLKVVNKIKLFLSKGWDEKETPRVNTAEATEETTV